jgi:hypothetical protein
MGSGDRPKWPNKRRSPNPARTSLRVDCCRPVVRYQIFDPDVSRRRATKVAQQSATIVISLQQNAKFLLPPGSRITTSALRICMFSAKTCVGRVRHRKHAIQRCAQLPNVREKQHPVRAVAPTRADHFHADRRFCFRAVPLAGRQAGKDFMTRR